MTLVDDLVAQLRRGECSARKRHEAPCSTCDAVDRRIAHVLALDAFAIAATRYITQNDGKSAVYVSEPLDALAALKATA